MTVLALDASTARATVAVVRSGAVLAAAEVAERSEHVEPLLPAALALLASASLSLADLSAIVCGAGPGGFTGLRTAASIAKGLAMGLEIPLYAVPSLALIVTNLPAARYLAVLDAGRGDRFAALFDGPRAERSRRSRLSPTDQSSAKRIDAPRSGARYRLVPATQVSSIAAESGATVVGPETGQWPHVRGAAGLDWGEPIDLASWEPDYGRDSAAQDRRRAGAAP